MIIVNALQKKSHMECVWIINDNLCFELAFGLLISFASWQLYFPQQGENGEIYLTPTPVYHRIINQLISFTKHPGIGTWIRITRIYRNLKAENMNICKKASMDVAASNEPKNRSHEHATLKFHNKYLLINKLITDYLTIT